MTPCALLPFPVVKRSLPTPDTFLLHRFPHIRLPQNIAIPCANRPHLLRKIPLSPPYRHHFFSGMAPRIKHDISRYFPLSTPVPVKSAYFPDMRHVPSYHTHRTTRTKHDTPFFMPVQSMTPPVLKHTFSNFPPNHPVQTTTQPAHFMT